MSGFETTVNVAAPATLGRLYFEEFGGAQLGNQTLTFNNPGIDPALIQQEIQTSVVTINSPISIVSGEALRTNIANFGTLALAGGITSATGDLTKVGDGALQLNGASATWNGTLFVNSGLVVVNNAAGLGTSAGHTILNGGTLRLTKAVNEPFEFAGGALETTVPQILSSPITTNAGTTAMISGPFNIQGGSTGGGDISLSFQSSELTVSNVPLSHQGGLTITSTLATKPAAHITVNNTYTGPTSLSGIIAEVTVPDGLGSADQGTTVTNGTLRLHVNSKESVRLVNSSLRLWRGATNAPDESFDGHITLKNSTLSVTEDSSPALRYSIANPIVLDGGVNSLIASGRSLRIAGGIVGQGDLFLNGGNADLIFDSKIESTGSMEIRGGPVRFVAPNAYAGSALVRNGGDLVADSPQHMSRVQTGSQYDSCCNPYGSIRATTTGSLTIDDLGIFEGLLKGDIRANPIGFYGMGSNRDIQNLYSGVDAHLYGGRLRVNDSDATLSPSNGRIFVDRMSEAMVRVQGTTHADFHLNNGSGFAFGGALLAPSDGSAAPFARLQGDIYLGDQGAYIGGGGSIRAEGQIYGADLHLVGDLQVVGAPTAYTGKTSVQFGQLDLWEQGKLANTSRIEIYPRGSVIVDVAKSEGPVADHIDDNVPIDLYGGSLSVWPSETGVQTAEHVGHVTLKRGVSRVAGTVFYSNAAPDSADLVINDISREPGTVLSIDSTSRVSTDYTQNRNVGDVRISLDHPLPMVNGILPAWLNLAGVEFTKYDGSGHIVGIENQITVPLNSADSTSIAGAPANNAPLAQDTTIHALYALSPVNLGGHTLTVNSGGIIGGDLSNGVVRPGNLSDGELYIYGSSGLSAAIVDNGRPTSAIFANDTTLSGHNTYTGKTYVNGFLTDVTIASGDALPTGGDIDINAGNLWMQQFGDYHFQLGTITLRDGGTIGGSCCTFDETITAKKLVLESGIFNFPLVGNVPIVKNTDGIARFSDPTPSSKLTGTVEIDDGLLIAQNNSGSGGGFLSFGSSSVTVNPHGRLALAPISPDFVTGKPTPSLTLAGGSLYPAGTSSSDYVQWVGPINVVQSSKIYLLDGTATDIVLNDLHVTGPINVAAGKTLELIGRSNDLFGPELIVTDGIKLAPGATLAGSGAVRGKLEISGSGIVSPGPAFPGTSVGMFAMNAPIFNNELMSTMVLGKGGEYQWEINDAAGDAGAVFGKGWDLLAVRGDVNITATPDAPFLIKLIGLGADGLPGHIDHLIFGQVYQWKIVEANSIANFNPANFIIDASSFGNGEFVGLGAGGLALGGAGGAAGHSEFWLTRDGTTILLNARVVPEPATITSVGYALASLLLMRRRKRAMLG